MRRALPVKLRVKSVGGKCWVRGVEAVFKQTTQFRIVALQEDLETREVTRLNAAVVHRVKIGKPLTLAIEAPPSSPRSPRSPTSPTTPRRFFMSRRKRSTHRPTPIRQLSTPTPSPTPSLRSQPPSPTSRPTLHIRPTHDPLSGDTHIATPTSTKKLSLLVPLTPRNRISAKEFHQHLDSRNSDVFITLSSEYRIGCRNHRNRIWRLSLRDIGVIVLWRLWCRLSLCREEGREWSRRWSNFGLIDINLCSRLEWEAFFLRCLISRMT
ncbi:hypothetical protein BC829DRAFT_86800 [Chytridium lagenaria]|nr:hypothetical protein BC829DRAFT_86800 [Chytridium lagenaria]